MKIRKLEKNDINKISEMYKKEMSIHFKNIGEKPISKEEYEKRLKESFNRDYIFILEEERIIGFLWFSKNKY